MKTKEQVLAMNLSPELKKRAEDYFMAQERFGKPASLNANTNKEVELLLQGMQTRYKARKEAEARKKQRKLEEQAQISQIYSLVKQAKAAGFSSQEILDTLNEKIKEKKNAAILRRIEELKSQLI